MDARGGTVAMGYVAIYIPEFPSLAWLRLNPSARSHAVAVVEGTAPLERIVSFNRAAKALGLEHGMSKLQAETSGRILFHARSLDEEQAAIDLVFEAAEHFSPRVQIIASPVNAYAKAIPFAATFLLDQSGTEKLFGSPKSFAEKVRNALRDLEFPSSVAVAPNAEASLLLARSYAGVTCVDENDVQSKLASLPLSMLCCDAPTLATLNRWGIRSLRELTALPEAALVSRIGQKGRRLQRLALGIEDNLLVPEDPAFVLSDYFALDGPLESLEPLLFILSPMLEKLLRQAINHAYALRSVTIILEIEKCAPHQVEVRPAVPVQNKDLLLKLLNLKLQADPPRAGILGVRLTAEPAIPQVSQRGLFQSQFPEPDKLDLLIARLKSIVGEANVGSARLSNSFCDDEFTMELFTPITQEVLSTPTSVCLALRRFRPLQPARVVFHGTAPSLLFWKGERLEISDVTGPWQSSGYWWDGRRWEADEWDAIVTRPPQALRLRHEPELGTWYVAGQYD